jgi:hypothetical protein
MPVRMGLHFGSVGLGLYICQCELVTVVVRKATLLQTFSRILELVELG